MRSLVIAELGFDALDRISILTGVMVTQSREGEKGDEWMRKYAGMSLNPREYTKVGRNEESPAHLYHELPAI